MLEEFWATLIPLHPEPKLSTDDIVTELFLGLLT